MALYRLQFVDYGNAIYLTQDIEYDHDEHVIEAAQRVNIPNVSAGFEVWEGDRLVHRHRNCCGTEPVCICVPLVGSNGRLMLQPSPECPFPEHSKLARDLIAAEQGKGRP